MQGDGWYKEDSKAAYERVNVLFPEAEVQWDLHSSSYIFRGL
jgi:hypothetical protein